MPFEEVGVRAVVKNARGYQRDLDRMDKRTKRFGGAFGGLAKQALAVGAGFVAAQVSMAGVQKIMSSTIGAAIAFEAQLAQIRALTGATAEDTQFLEGAIKDMARALPKSPAELGAGAYFILSSGIEDAADAAEVLEVAAKASTIGLGETESVANALTTVLNAYGKSAGEAGQVTDVMIEAVKQGKAEASEFAGVLGRVVPLAAQMGISFEEVAANLATFTRLGVSAEEAATGLRQVMASLLKPTEDQEEAMAELGLSAEGLRQQIREKGLLVTLDAMTEATGGNETAIARLFPNIRALTSVLGTAGVQMEDYTNILAATENATGNLEEGFAIVADTAQFKTRLAMNKLNVELIEAGAVVLPLVARLAETAAANIALLGAAAAAAKGDFSRFNKETAHTAFRLFELTFALPGTEKKFHESARAVEDAAEFLGLWSRAAEKTTLSAGETAHEIARMKASAAAMAAEIANAVPPVDALTGAMNSLRSSIEAISGAQKDNLATISSLTGARTREQVALEQQINALGLELNAAEMAEVGQSRLGGATSSTTDALDKQIGTLQNLAASLVPDELRDQVIALEGELKALELGRLEIEAQLQPRELLLQSLEDQRRAAEDEVGALNDELQALQKTGKEIRGQLDDRSRLIELQSELAMLASAPARLEETKLELEREKILQRVAGNTDDLTGEERKRLKQIKKSIDALRQAAKVAGLEAKVTELEAEASDQHREAITKEIRKIEESRKALEEELRSIEAQIEATDKLKTQREAYIDTLVPPELRQEIDQLRDQKAELDNQIAATSNLKAQREAYIATLVPPELQQEIDQLQRQKTKLDNASTAARGFGGAISSATEGIRDQITKLGLERDAIDLVTEGWGLQAQAMLNLPTIKDISQGLKQFQAMLVLQAQQELIAAISAFDVPRVFELSQLISKLTAFNIPEFHSGALSIPRDMVAQLQAGEMVLPRAQAEVVRDLIRVPSAIPAAAAAQAGAVSRHIEVYVTDGSPAAIANAVKMADIELGLRTATELEGLS